MSQPRKWVDEIVDTLTDLGGLASLKQIRDRIEDRAIMDFAANKNWDAAIRGTLEDHSSDSKEHQKPENKNKQNLFYSLYGVEERKGWSGLRSMVKRTPSALDLPADDPVAADRVPALIYRILRDTILARSVKSIYEYRCQLCDVTVELPDGSNYAEGHHIKPLGRPHNGLDVVGNILCVCPMHHVQLDYGCIRLELGQIRCHHPHQLDTRYIDYHNLHVFRARVVALPSNKPKERS